MKLAALRRPVPLALGLALGALPALVAGGGGGLDAPATRGRWDRPARSESSAASFDAVAIAKHAAHAEGAQRLHAARAADARAGGARSGSPRCVAAAGIGPEARLLDEHESPPRREVSDVRLLRSDGTTTTLRSLADGRPLAVIVIKGDWCAACRAQLASSSRELAAMERVGGAVVALSRQRPSVNRRLRRDLDLDLEVLSDPDGRVVAALGLSHPSAGHPIPGLAFLDRCGAIERVVPGRTPGVLQDALMLRTLRALAAEPPCGALRV